jgi:hypothetical protein
MIGGGTQRIGEQFGTRLRAVRVAKNLAAFFGVRVSNSGNEHFLFSRENLR